MRDVRQPLSPSRGRTHVTHMNDTPNPRLTRSVEDYLKAVYSLTEREQSASTSALAEALEVQPASVTGMVKRLAELGYLEHVRYRGVRLTKAGSREDPEIDGEGARRSNLGIGTRNSSPVGRTNV